MCSVPFLTSLLCFAASSLLAAPDVTIVDIIPNTMKLEHSQNAEPNLAVNPADPTKMVISVFGPGAGNPIFISKDRGNTWALLQRIPAGDISVGWGGPYDAFLTALSPSGAAITTLRLHDPTIRSVFRPLPRSTYRPSDSPDQPWTEAGFAEGVARIYVTNNDLSQATKTASMHQSLDGGRTWRNIVLEKVTPGDGSDGAAVRSASTGDTVYAAFQRFNATTGPDETGDIVVVRDDAGGANSYLDLGASGVGVNVATGERLPQGYLGQERLGSDLSIAVDPVDPTRVVIAYAAVRAGQVVVVVKISQNSGATWAESYQTPADSGLPALAITPGGTIGLLSTRYDGTHLETHLTETNNEFTSNTDILLSSFVDTSVALEFDPFIGDYEDLVAVGNTFYGTFSASNNTAGFPKKPIFLRDESLLGTARVPYSIDPFFFRTVAIP